MRIVFVSDDAYINGGLAQVAVAEAIGLSTRGHQVLFFAATDRVDSRLEAAGVQVEVLGQKDLLNARPVVAVWRGLYNPTGVSRLRAILSQLLDPGETVVHFHSWMKGLSPAILAVPRSVGIRSVATLHDYFLGCPNGGFLEYPIQQICHRQGASLSCLACNCDSRNYGHKLWRYGRLMLQDRVLRSPRAVDRFISVSEFNARRIETYIPKGTPHDVLHNPLEVRACDRVKAEENHTFLFVGRFSAEKGAHVFAEVVGQGDLPAVFVGDGELRPQLEKLAPNARFTGWLGTDEVQEEIRKARAVVFPSLWYESQPLTPVEAMAQGVPVVTSDECAAIDVVVDRGSGRHFRTGSTNSLSNVLEEISENDEQVQFLSRNAYEWYWDQPWSLDQHLDRLVNIYSKALGKPSVQ